MCVCARACVSCCAWLRGRVAAVRFSAVQCVAAAWLRCGAVWCVRAVRACGACGASGHTTQRADRRVAGMRAGWQGIAGKAWQAGPLGAITKMERRTHPVQQDYVILPGCALSPPKLRLCSNTGLTDTASVAAVHTYHTIQARATMRSHAHVCVRDRGVGGSTCNTKIAVGVVHRPGGPKHPKAPLFDP